MSFDPTNAGSRSATLHIGSASIALTGIGEAFLGDAPLPLWSYAALAFVILMIAAAAIRRSTAA